MMDIVIGNLVFWPIYIFVGMLPYRVMQQIIDGRMV